MIEMLADLIGLVVALLKIDLILFGFTFSLWQLMIFTVVAGILIDLIGGFIGGNK